MARPPALLRRSTSMLSDGTGSTDLQPVVEGRGHTKRASSLKYKFSLFLPR